MWRKLFDEDTPLMRALAVATDLLLINLLAFAGILTVAASGASIIALFDLSGQLARGEESYIVRGFLASVKKHFFTGLKIGAVLLLFLVVFISEIWGIQKYFAGNLMLIIMVCFAATLITTILLIAVMLFARYDNTFLVTIKNSFLMSIGFLPYTVAILFVWVLWIFILLRFWTVILPVGMMFGLSLPAYLSMMIYEPALKKSL